MTDSFKIRVITTHKPDPFAMVYDGYAKIHERQFNSGSRLPGKNEFNLDSIYADTFLKYRNSGPYSGFNGDIPARLHFR